MQIPVTYFFSHIFCAADSAKKKTKLLELGSPTAGGFLQNLNGVRKCKQNAEVANEQLRVRAGILICNNEEIQGRLAKSVNANF